MGGKAGVQIQGNQLWNLHSGLSVNESWRNEMESFMASNLVVEHLRVSPRQTAELFQNVESFPSN